MANIRLVLEAILILSPLGILLLVAAPRIRASVGLVSARGQLLMMLALLGLMIIAGIGSFLTVGRLHTYNAVMMLAAVGIVAARVVSYLKADRKG